MPIYGIVVVEAFHFIRSFAWSILVFPVVKEFGKHPVWSEFVFFSKDSKGGKFGVCEAHLDNNRGLVVY